MAIDIYDLALLNKIKTVFANTVYMSEEHGNSYKQAVKSLGELKFPLVSIYRPDGYTRSSFNTTYQNLGRYIVTSSTGKPYHLELYKLIWSIRWKWHLERERL